MSADYIAWFLFHLSVAYGRGLPLAELDHLFRCAHFPYEISGPALYVLRWLYG